MTPPLKWVGGKASLVKVLTGLMPYDAAQLRHVEPFVGGGALFFARRPERALLSDANQQLIETYKALRYDVEAVIAALQPLAADHSAEWYYARRREYNDNAGTLTLERRAALFIFLNRRCFNGMHRVNKRGEFNVPVGSYAKLPAICNPDVLRAASAALQGIALRCTDFDEVLAECGDGDVVYADPPYVPRSKTANFTGYGAAGFREQDHVRLQIAARAAVERGAFVILSNSDTTVVRELYSAPHWRIHEVEVPRRVNSKASGRGPVPELVIVGGREDK